MIIYKVLFLVAALLSAYWFLKKFILNKEPKGDPRTFTDKAKGASQGNAALEMMQLMSIKAAKDLALDMKVTK